MHDHDRNAHTDSGRGAAFAAGIALNTTFVAIEATYGVASHSTALVADALHNASDVLGLALAWLVSGLARRKPTQTHTYGLRHATILGALGNALLVLVAVGGVTWEAIGRFSAPEPVPGGTMMIVAAAGVIVNGVSALFFMRASARDANIRGALLHLLADAAVSLGVVVAGAILWKTGWWWLDPVTTLTISVVVFWGTWTFLKQTLHLALAGVPSHIDIAAVRAHLAGLPGVTEVHDLHVWPVGTTQVALTAHLVVPWPATPPEFLDSLPAELRDLFEIDHATIQLEPTRPQAECPPQAQF